LKREDNSPTTKAKEEREKGKRKRKRGWKIKQTGSSIFS
jgi:hypothetical protein